MTADHGHTSQIVAEDSNGTSGPTGYARGPADQGRPEAAHQPTARPAASRARRPRRISQQHTGTEVRIGAIGPQAARVNGVIDETDINGILTSFLGTH